MMNGPHIPHAGHGGGGLHPHVQNWRPWWRGWNETSNSFPVVYETIRTRDNRPLYFLGGAVLIGALILSRR